MFVFKAYNIIKREFKGYNEYEGVTKFVIIDATNTIKPRTQVNSKLTDD